MRTLVFAATTRRVGTPSRALLLLVLLPLLIIVMSSSSANAQGIALSRFDPSERGSRFFVADSLELQHHVTPDGRKTPRLSVGIPVSYANRSRTFGSTAEGERSRLVATALYLHPGASVVISPGARFAFDFPIAALQDGTSTNLGGMYYIAPASPRLGDLRASFDLRLFSSHHQNQSEERQREPDGVTIAGGVRAWFPTGSATDFTGEDTTRFGIHATSTARFGFVLATVRVGYMYRRELIVGGTSVGAEMNTAVGIAWVSTDNLWTIGPELYGATLIDRFFKTKNTPVEALLGVHRTLFGSFRIGAALGTSIVSGLGAAHLRTVVSAEWISGHAGSSAKPLQDRDQDGVPDDDDVCPDVAGLRDGPSPGCPAPPVDSDGDGILDNEDACIDVPGVRTRDVKTHGCPTPDSAPSTPSPSSTPIEPPTPEPEPQPEPNPK